MVSQRKTLASIKDVRRIMADHFRELDEAARTGSRKIAWCTSVGPAELLRAMGFLVFFPENHGAMLGATRMAADLIPAANAIGYSPDICSYLTADIGSYLKKQTPLITAFGMEGAPKPDVLVYSTNQCRDVQDWFSWYGREFDAPVIGVVAPRGLGDVKKSHIEDQTAQLKGLIPTLEQVSGKKFDLDRLKEVVAESLAMTKLWRTVLETGRAKPSPLTFFDATILMGPAVVGRGLKEATAVYHKVLAELDGMIEAGEGAVENEKWRLYWDGMPIWGKLRSLSDLFLRLDATVVASTYCNSWIFDSFDPEKPFEGMALAYIELFIVRNDEYKEAYIRDWGREFDIDGILFHDSKTCPNNSNARYGMPGRLNQALNAPTMIIDGDLNDLRLFSEEQTVTKIEAFMEQLAEG